MRELLDVLPFWLIRAIGKTSKWVTQRIHYILASPQEPIQASQMR